MIDFKKKYEKYKYKYYSLIKLEKNKKMQGGVASESLINIFGITGSIGLFAIIASIIYFLFNNKKKKDEDEDEDEDMIQLKHNIANKETKELTNSANTNIDINNDSYNIEQKEKELLEGQLQDNSRRLQEFEETLAKEDTEEVDDILDEEERLKRLLKTASEKEEHQRIIKEREELLNKFEEFKINMAKDKKDTDQETSLPVSPIEDDDDMDAANDEAIKLYNKNALKKAFETLKSQKEDDADERAIEFYNKNTLQKTLKTLKSQKEDDANEKAIEFYKKNALQKTLETLKSPKEKEDDANERAIEFYKKNALQKIIKALETQEDERRLEEERRLKKEEERLAREEREKEERLKREKEEKESRKTAEQKIQKIAEELQKQRKADYFKEIKKKNEEKESRKTAEQKIQKMAEELQKPRKADYFKEKEQKKMQYDPLKQCILDNLQKKFTELIKYKIE